VDGVPIVSVAPGAASVNEAGTPLSVSDVAFEIVALVELPLTSTVIVPTLSTEPCAFSALYVVTVNDVSPTGAVTVPEQESVAPVPVHPATPAPISMTVTFWLGAPVTTGTIETDRVAAER